ncbi:uncharacterized protein [Bactrocera oleae]|uniref:uncharacterized protein n=1 Tax=Bactrocera oleae TaxID=104688 RepID=UPI00387E69AE
MVVYSSNDTTVVSWETGEKKYRLVSCYMLYDEVAVPSQLFKELVRDTEASKCSITLGCDSNAHHTLFGSTDINEMGWIVSGRYKTGSNNISKPSCLFLANESLDAKLKKLWKLEQITTIPEPWTREQQSCDHIYNSTVSRRPCGRIVVKLPFKDDPTCLGESYTTALRRFNAQERRLAKSPQLKTHYVEFMSDYESLGHMSVVKNPNLSEPHYYIPYHCVLKPTSTTTKLRVVFDASCRTTSQKSLNDIQMVGPTIQCELFLLLIRFRFHRFAFTADIVKMYRQVLMHEDDRKFQYILWRSSPTEDIRTYQLNTVTYGMAAAPYFAIRSLLYLAEQHSEQFTIGAKIVKSSFYVDDLLCGADPLTELAQIKQEVIPLLELGQFKLTKWHTNYHQFREDDSIKDLNRYIHH